MAGLQGEAGKAKRQRGRDREKGWDECGRRDTHYAWNNLI